MAASLSATCTCAAPESVDLTKAHSNASLKTNTTKSFECSQKLLDNLKQFGWTHVSLDLFNLPEACLLREQCDFWKDPKSEILKLFDPTFCSQNPFPNASFYTAESGAADGDGVEPKQSWEAKRCSSETDETTVLDLITQAMHSIVVTVNSVLKLPPNLLLQEGNPQAYGSNCQNGSSPGNGSNIDLLRVFHYEKVDSGPDQILGSSPHTDWGTWTVVWQDNVGGLQTFCQGCQAWKDVQVFDSQEGTLQFVIHVGDATSLAMAQAHVLVQEEQQSSLLTTNDTFPSPKHRVLSPTQEPRASLVYFVYPPPANSLETLSTGLKPWVKSHTQGPRGGTIDYSCYYLLQDQSAGACSGNEKDRTPKDVFDDIYSKPMRQVFVEKWQQVQRS